MYFTLLLILVYITRKKYILPLENSKKLILRELTKKYSCIPVASVASKPLFRIAGIICDRKRNTLELKMTRTENVISQTKNM